MSEKKYKATATLTKEIEVIFDDDGHCVLIDQAIEAFEFEHNDASGTVEFENIEITELDK